MDLKAGTNNTLNIFNFYGTYIKKQSDKLQKLIFWPSPPFCFIDNIKIALNTVYSILYCAAKIKIKNVLLSVTEKKLKCQFLKCKTS